MIDRSTYTPPSWLATLDEPTRQSVYAQMRTLREKSDAYNAAYRRLAPRNGDIPVGGAHIDEFANAEVIASFLSAIGKGKTPDEARADGKAMGRLIFEKWNERRKKDYQVHRWVESLDTTVDIVCRFTEERVAAMVETIDDTTGDGSTDQTTADRSAA